LYLWAALTYLRFDQQRRQSDYVWATVLFLAALFTKTVTATLPAALLVIFWWQRGKLDWRRDVMPLLPWFVLGAAGGLLTAHFEKEFIGAHGAEFALSFADRLVLAGRVFWFYLGKLVWPADLVFIYPRWSIDASVAWQWLFTAAGSGLLGALVGWSRRSRGPLAAALFFGGSLFPALGFFNVYPFLFSYVADHFQYLASLGVFALAGAGLALAGERFGRQMMWGGAGVLLAACAVLTWNQSAIYRDESSLWQATLARNPDCWIAHNNLALVLANDGRAAEAVPHLETALRLRPDFPEALNNLAGQYVDQGRAAEALPVVERALTLQPKYPAASNTRGRALLALGRADDAARCFDDAVKLDPQFTTAWCNLGLAEVNRGHAAEALPHFARAAQLDPNYLPAEFLAGATLVQLNRPAEAVPHLERALALDEDHAMAHFQLALALRSLGRTAEANQHYQAAIQLDPRLAR
ncbi:MAG TPA: tetratricopeptide repeat protein, partial [Candidatus Didemnitutus sp.]|nr:tetratricopeptide repeat protein [Candidatus Didemnitutus sp.]